uniref:Uncharacterized protein n=1 Tax=Pectinophora gossypiella TaxID=13191 RepID=A0A1E1WBW2_PECGO
MISPTNLMKRLGVGGRLVAFFKAVCVYFVVAGGEAGEAPSVAGVAAKCAPVLCLMVLVALHALDAPAHCSDRKVTLSVKLRVSSSSNVDLPSDKGSVGRCSEPIRSGRRR